MDRLDRTQTASAVNVVAGLWLIISPFVLGFRGLGYATSNHVVVGILVAVLAGVVIWHEENGWANWINLFLGIWMILSPFIMLYSAYPTPTTNSILLGVLIAVVSIVVAFIDRAAASGPIFRATEPEEERLFPHRHRVLTDAELDRIDTDVNRTNTDRDR